jgi:hypothetical protein
MSGRCFVWLIICPIYSEILVLSLVYFLDDALDFNYYHTTIFLIF